MTDNNDNIEFDQAAVAALPAWNALDYLRTDEQLAAYLLDSLHQLDLSPAEQVALLRAVIEDAVAVLNRRKDTPRELKEGDVVQLTPDVGNPMFACCMMTVTEPKPWGAQGYVQMTGENGQPGGQAFYRAKWEEMEYVGEAAWGLKGEGDDT